MALTNIETTIILDLYDHDTTPTKIKAIQLDSNTRYVSAVIRNRSGIYDVGQTAGVTLTIIRPDKVGVQITGEPVAHTETTPDQQVITTYGAYAELSLVALAVKGNLKAQFMLKSSDQVLRTEIFTISCGEALDASTDTWAGEYQGYNLDELVQNVNESVAKVDAMEQDVSELKSGFSDLYNTAYVTDSASGAVAHFEDGADNVPLKSLKVNIEPFQSGSGDPSPENDRPIGGWDAVKATRNGRNFCKSAVTATRTNLNGLTATPNGDGSITVNGTSTATTILYFNLATLSGNGNSLQSNGMKNLPNGTYRFGTLPDGIRLQIYGSDVPNAGASDAHFISDSTRGNFTISRVYRYNWVRLSVSGNTTLNNAVVYPAIYFASDTDDTYEPYTGETYEVSLASAGTVYGGTLDAVSGELTVDRKYELFDGSSDETWQFLTGSFGNRCGIVRNDVLNTGVRVKVDANEGVYSANANTVGTVFASGVSIYYYPPATVTTLEEYRTWLASNNLQVVYPLATPITYNLTPTEVKSLLGINNVWSDAGDVTAEYRADTKLYIKRLTDSDTDMIADTNITSGQYFMVGNDLYRATVNIASGAQIVVGTNATKVSLSEALNEINA